jgi:hypothetical protein
VRRFTNRAFSADNGSGWPEWMIIELFWIDRQGCSDAEFVVLNGILASSAS